MSLEAEWMIPEHLRAGVERYVDQGIPPGHFLTAVIESDLFEAFGRGDQESINRLHSLVMWFYNYAPSACWGSREKRFAWQKLHADKRAAVSP